MDGGGQAPDFADAVRRSQSLREDGSDPHHLRSGKRLRYNKDSKFGPKGIEIMVREGVLAEPLTNDNNDASKQNLLDPIDKLILGMVNADPDLADKIIAAQLVAKGVVKTMSRQAVNRRRKTLELTRTEIG
jgi:hypothetical protein